MATGKCGPGRKGRQSRPGPATGSADIMLQFGRFPPAHPKHTGDSCTSVHSYCSQPSCWHFAFHRCTPARHPANIPSKNRRPPTKRKRARPPGVRPPRPRRQVRIRRRLLLADHSIPGHRPVTTRIRGRGVPLRLRRRNRDPTRFAEPKDISSKRRNYRAVNKRHFSHARHEGRRRAERSWARPASAL